jgi:hypothetical protein
MANTNDPRGFLIYKGDGKTMRTTRYAKGAAVIYEGDLVERVAAGTLQTATAGSSNRIVGVAARYAAASEGFIDVFDDPDTTFLAQCDNTTAYAVADNGQNVDIAAGTPDTDLLRSGQVIDMNTKGLTATLPLKVLGLAQGINGGENGAGVNALLLVKLNHAERGAGIAGI